MRIARSHYAKVFLMLCLTVLSLQRVTAQETQTKIDWPVKDRSSNGNIFNQNLSNVKVDDLSEQQIRQIVDQITASGKAIEDVPEIVADRGMAPEEVSKLNSRLKVLYKADLNLESDDEVKTITGKKELAFEKPVQQANVLPVFGAEYFNNPRSSFAPNINRPTPLNYVVGPGDQLLINVFGNSVVDWKLDVKPEGYILLPGMGNVYVSGKTMEQATELIKDRLRANRYAIGNGTDVTISLSNIRTIRVHMNGEVRKPGPYNLPSVTTLLNALYEAGGPNDIGSIRSIQVFRDNQLIADVDVYQYILRGDRSGDILLKDDDIVYLRPYRVRVALEGEVKRPAYYELKPGESFKDVLEFAGGFTDNAYRSSVKAVQISDKSRKVRDVSSAEFDAYVPLKGDRYIVEPIIDRIENRVSITGAVFRPGQFELQDGLTLAELIKNADGVKEDAFQERGTITRLKADNTTEVIAFDVRGVLNGQAPEILLQREDIVHIPSIFDLRESYEIIINGSVRKPGRFPYKEGMTVEDLIITSGGFSDGANMQMVEVARRVKDSDRRSRDAKLSEIISLDIDPNLSVASSKFKLEPFDVVSVFSLPGYVKPQMVTIEGEVMLPGTYAMRSKDDRLSDLIKRANGFTAYAYLKGASLKRADLIETESDEVKQSMKVAQFNEKQAQASRGTTSLNLDDVAKRNDFVDIDLEEVLRKPKGKKDLILLDGDVVSIPRELQTVKVTGEVFSPTTTMFSKGQNLAGYVMRSGGFTEEALRKKAYVVYANGAVKGTKSFLFFKNYPNLEPGAEIFVPKRKPRKDADPATIAQTWIGLGSALAALSTTLIVLITNNRNQ
jgi:protein involved in polysaccharide export with SLBB domain